MAIRIKRVYEPVEPSDGWRVLVDRIWPRGLSKQAAAIDEWLKDIAPSTELRRWFGHDPQRWQEFRQRYTAELRAHRQTLRGLAARARREPVTLLFAASDTERNNAAVLRQYLGRLRA